MYGEKCGFQKFVKYRHEVEHLEQSSNYETTGQWSVKVRDLSSGVVRNEIFDAVMVCTGHHVTPLVPKFANQHKFKGIFSIVFRVPIYCILREFIYLFFC